MRSIRRLEIAIAELLDLALLPRVALLQVFHVDFRPRREGLLHQAQERVGLPLLPGDARRFKLGIQPPQRRSPGKKEKAELTSMKWRSSSAR